MSLIIIGTLELVATAFEIMAVIIWMILWFLNKPSPIKEDNLQKGIKKSSDEENNPIDERDLDMSCLLPVECQIKKNST